MAGEERHAVGEAEGRACDDCRGCREGEGPGIRSRSLEAVAEITKAIACCDGNVCHSVLRCRTCKACFLTTYIEHTDSELDRITIQAIGGKEASEAVRKINECKTPKEQNCRCAVHEAFLKGGIFPIRGEKRFSAYIQR